MRQKIRIKTPLIPLITIIFLSGCAANDNVTKNESISLLSKGNGTTYVFNDKAVSVEFPSRPKKEIDKVKNILGDFEMTYYGVENDNLEIDPNYIYSLTVTELPIDHELSKSPKRLSKYYEGSIIGTVDKSEGKLISQRDLSLGTYKGKEIVVSIEKFDAISVSRVYVFGKTEYILQVITPVGNRNNSKKDKFFESLALVK